MPSQEALVVYKTNITRFIASLSVEERISAQFQYGVESRFSPLSE